MKATILIGATMLALAGCADPAREEVRQADYGERWPLRAPVAVVGCSPPDLRYLEVDGIRYGINGPALRAGFPEAGQARKDGTPGPLADFIERAGALCGR